MKEWIEYILAFYLQVFVLILPEFVLKIVLRLLIPVAKFFLYSRQRLMLQNLLYCFSEKSLDEIIDIANNVWFNISWTFVISIKYICNPKKIFLKLKLPQNFNLNKTLGNCIIVTGHIGNWELLAQRLVLEGYKIAAITRPLKNKLIEYRVKNLREKLGGKVFYAHQLKEVISWLKSGGIIYVLPDQHIVEGSVRVNFLGRPAYTSPVVRVLNKRLKSKVIPMFCINKGDQYEVFVEQEYVPVNLPQLKKDLEYNTLKLNEIIEKYVRLYPSQWMWLHRRWKN